MKIACEACGAKYTIADDKVRGRKVKIRCKGCGTPIVVDGQHGGGPSLSDAETDAALEPDAPVVWSVNLSDTDSRTMSVEELVAGYESGLVTADAFVWKDGMADWVPLLESELAPLLRAAPAAAAPAAASPAAAAVPRAAMPQFTAPNAASAATTGSRPNAARSAARAQPEQNNTQDLFGGIETAGADEEVATSAPVLPQAGSTAYDDGKLTGARNENSVLFSLDAMKAGFSPSAPPPGKSAPKAPKAPSGRPQQPSNPDDPFGMGTNGGLPGMGGGVLFGGDNQALLTAPAPPPPPAPTPAQIAAGVVPVAAQGNKKLTLILGSVGGVAIIGLLIALLVGQKHDATNAAASAMNATSGAPSASAAPDEAKKEEAPAAKPEDKPADSATASAAPSASAAPETKSTAVAAARSEAPKKPKEEAPAPAAADAPPFSKASAISALTAASSAAGSCKKLGGPTGSAKATVTFAPSGRVTTATVGGSFAGTSVGGCVAGVFRRAHVPAFSGSSVTVSKSFTIN